MHIYSLAHSASLAVCRAQCHVWLDPQVHRYYLRVCQNFCVKNTDASSVLNFLLPHTQTHKHGKAHRLRSCWCKGKWHQIYTAFSQTSLVVINLDLIDHLNKELEVLPQSAVIWRQLRRHSKRVGCCDISGNAINLCARACSGLKGKGTFFLGAASAVTVATGLSWNLDLVC